MSTQLTDPTESDPEMLPDTYDTLIAVDQLVHGKYNPRQVPPKKTLTQSIANVGISRPLIVWYETDKDVYQITDGWQRYQAATDCGWEYLPVQIYDTPMAALKATKVDSISRDWSTYDWAQYCQSIAEEIERTTQSKKQGQDLVEQVAEQSGRSESTVRRYLDVLSLPKELHPLLNEGPEGSTEDWAALQNHNQQIRRYNGLRWTVAARLARKQADLSRSQVVRIATKAIQFTKQDSALQFIDRAAEQPEKPLAEIRKCVEFGAQHNHYLEVPQVAIKMDDKKKQAVLEYCHRERQSLSNIIEQRLTELAESELN